MGDDETAAEGMTAYMTITDFGCTGWLRFRGMGCALGVFWYILW
jgi:hypothetical protein